MSKRVKLTRKEDNNIVEEIVILLDDDDILWVKDDVKKENIPVGMTVEKFLATDLVWFEDRDGVFGIDPREIIKIEEEKHRAVGS